MKNFDHCFLLHICIATLFTFMCMKYEGAVTHLQVAINRFLSSCHSSRNPYSGMLTNQSICFLSGIKLVVDLVFMASTSRISIASTLNSLSNDGISFPSKDSINLEELIEDHLNENASDESGSDEDEECSKELFKSRSHSKMTRIGAVVSYCEESTEVDIEENIG